MAERGHARIEEVAASHASMVSQPEAVTRLILSAVAATAAVPRPPGQRLRAPDSDLVLCRSRGSLFRTPPGRQHDDSRPLPMRSEGRYGLPLGAVTAWSCWSQVGWTAKTCHSSGTPIRAWIPRSWKRIPEPATRSFTVEETTTSSAPASDVRRMLGVGLVGARRIQAAHVGCFVGPDGSRRISKDRLDDQSDDQGASDAESDGKASNSQLAPPTGHTRRGSGSMLFRVDQVGRIPDRSHTRGLSGASRRSTPGLERRSAAKRSPSSTPR